MVTLAAGGSVDMINTPCQVSPTDTALQPNKQTIHYITLQYTTLHYTTIHYITLQYTTIHYITFQYLHLTTITTLAAPPKLSPGKNRLTIS